jgi:FlgD Ig-like domain
MKQFLTFLFLIFSLVSISYAQIEIDGDMLDWVGIEPLDTGLPAESYGHVADNTYIDFDLRHVYVTHDSENVYFKIDLDDAASFDNFYNFGNPPVFELYMDTEIGDTTGFDWGWWNNAYNFYVNLAPTLHPDSTNKYAELYKYLGNRIPTYAEGEFEFLMTVPMAINDNKNQVEFSVPKEAVNFGSEFRPWIYSVGDFQWDMGASQLPLEGGGTMLKFDFWYGGGLVDFSSPDIVSTIEIDGDLLDWAAIPAADVDQISEELGDMPTGPEFDLMDIYTTSDSTNFYMRIDIDPSATFSGIYSNYPNQSTFQIFFDVNWGDTTGLGYGGFWRIPCDYMVDLSSALHPDSTSNQTPIYKYIADYDGAFEEFAEVEGAFATFAKNGDDNVVELSVPRSMINAGTDIRPWVYVVGNEDWDNEEYFPNTIVEEGPGTTEFVYYCLTYNFKTGNFVQKLADNSIVTAVGDYYGDSKVVDDFGLVTNYPNPFNPSTTIYFTLSERDNITINIYDVLGNKVMTLLNNEDLPAGAKYVNWNGRDSHGNKVTSGIYLFQISGMNKIVTRKMTLLK